MAILRKTLYIFLLLLLVPFVSAKRQAKPVPLTTEQRQQFTYYWYAARQAITEERYADAYALLQFCNAINPNDAQTLTFLGILYEAIGDEGRAREAYKKAFEIDPKDQWFKYSSALMSQQTDEGRKAALSVMEKAYKAQKPNADENLLDQLERMYISEEQWKKALQIQDELDRRKGYDAYSAMSRYRIYVLWRKPKKAIETIDKYLELDPTDIRFLLFRLELMEMTKASPKELYAMYDRILKYDPYNLMILNNYAWHLAIHGGDLSQAERMSQITIREEPNNPTYLDTYGWIMHLKGQKDLALFYLQKALWNATEGNQDEIKKHLKIVQSEK